jgi:TRAP-type mannitol/chloroaromatic compound transport system substrate-binding protein
MPIAHQRRTDFIDQNHPGLPVQVDRRVARPLQGSWTSACDRFPGPLWRALITLQEPCMSEIRRRRFLAGAALAGGSIGAPAVVRAQGRTVFNWKMTSAYVKGSPFYMDGPGSATDLARRIREMSDGRLNIQVFGAGELVPAFEGFDAVRAGTVEMNHANSYFWTGKTFAAQYFTAVPFGMNFQGMNGWLYDGGGQQLWNEVYEPFGMIAMPCGNTGVQMSGWFKKEINSVADLKGLKMRIPGLAGRVYANLGVDVKVLPGGEIFPALERGVIDAAEFVGPFQDRRLGLQKAAKFYYTTGWHESATVSELLINKAAWQKLPKDLQSIVENAAAACNVISEGWCQRNNSEAMEDLIRNQKVIARPLPDSVVKALRDETDKVLAEAIAKDPLTKKVHDSYFAFKAKFDRWSEISEEQYHVKVRG